MMNETASSVPVRPTPALQCITIGLSGSSMLSLFSLLGVDVNGAAAMPFSEMQRSSSVFGEFGTPWSGQDVWWYCRMTLLVVSSSLVTWIFLMTHSPPLVLHSSKVLRV